jgi:hypothetical protein
MVFIFPGQCKHVLHPSALQVSVSPQSWAEIMRVRCAASSEDSRGALGWDTTETPTAGEHGALDGKRCGRCASVVKFGHFFGAAVRQRRLRAFRAKLAAFFQGYGGRECIVPDLCERAGRFQWERKGHRGSRPARRAYELAPAGVKSLMCQSLSVAPAGLRAVFRSDPGLRSGYRLALLRGGSFAAGEFRDRNLLACRGPP